MSLLEVSEMSTGYRGVAVVRQLDLRVDEGEVVALLGPNGAGKTSTLLAISALNELITGDVKVLGRSIRGRRPHHVARDGVAHVPEDRGLFFRLTVGEHLRLGAGRGTDTIDQALSFFPALSPLMDRRAGLLSGGEQQMLALAQALATNPKLIIVDELSLGLAPILVARLLPVLRQIATSTGAGVLLVEQHVHLALEVADRAYVLNHGRLTLTEDAATLRAAPERLTATYLAGSTG